MRKLLSISLALLLLMSTIGVTIHKHYCESRLVATSLIPSVEDACDTDMPMDEDTCKDDHQHYGIDSPLVLIAHGFNLAPSMEWVAVQKALMSSITFNDFNTTPKFLADISPPLSEPNIYTKVQSFLL